MTERYPDDVLKRALNAYLPRKTEAEGIAAMRAVLEGHLAEQHCVWAPDEDRSAWDTGCGQTFSFFSDGPKENGTRFCQYCGRAVRDCSLVQAGTASDGLRHDSIKPTSGRLLSAKKAKASDGSPR